MAYIKLQGTQLFTGTALLDSSWVLVLNEEGIVKDIVKKDVAGDGVQTYNGIICPGFINCHCHLELSHLKNAIPQYTGLPQFILQILKQRTAAEETIQKAIAEYDKVLWQSGTMAVGDICNTPYTILQKQKSAVQYFNFLETISFVPSMAAKQFEAIKTLQQAFQQQLPAAFNVITPHAPYTVSPVLFEYINHQATGATLSIHNQESLHENIFFQTGEGDFNWLYKQLGIPIHFFRPPHCNSLPYYLPLLCAAKNIVLVHNTYTTEEDIDFALRWAEQQHQQLFWCICIRANLYIENVLPPLELLKKKGCKIVIGTDSLASNTDLNLFAELQTILRYFPKLRIEEVLSWATYEGAKALQMEKELGSFQKGKKPGVIGIHPDFKQAERLV